MFYKIYCVTALFTLILTNAISSSHLYGVPCQDLEPGERAYRITYFYQLNTLPLIEAFNLLTSPLVCDFCPRELLTTRDEILNFAITRRLDLRKILQNINNLGTLDQNEVLLSVLMVILNDDITLDESLKQSFQKTIFYLLRKRYLNQNSFATPIKGFCDVTENNGFYNSFKKLANDISINNINEPYGSCARFVELLLKKITDLSNKLNDCSNLIKIKNKPEILKINARKYYKPSVKNCNSNSPYGCYIQPLSPPTVSEVPSWSTEKSYSFMNRLMLNPYKKIYTTELLRRPKTTIFGKLYDRGLVSVPIPKPPEKLFSPGFTNKGMLIPDQKLYKLPQMLIEKPYDQGLVRIPTPIPTEEPFNPGFINKQMFLPKEKIYGLKLINNLKLIPGGKPYGQDFVIRPTPLINKNLFSLGLEGEPILVPTEKPTKLIPEYYLKIKNKLQTKFPTLWLNPKLPESNSFSRPAYSILRIITRLKPLKWLIKNHTKSVFTLIRSKLFEKLPIFEINQQEKPPQFPSEKYIKIIPEFNNNNKPFNKIYGLERTPVALKPLPWPVTNNIKPKLQFNKIPRPISWVPAPRVGLRANVLAPKSILQSVLLIINRLSPKPIFEDLRLIPRLPNQNKLINLLPRQKVTIRKNNPAPLLNIRTRNQFTEFNNDYRLKDFIPRFKPNLRPQQWLNIKPNILQPWWSEKPKRPQLNLEPNRPHLWLNLKPNISQPRWNLKPKKPQPWLNLKPNSPQPWWNLIPKNPQPWLNLKLKEPQPWLNLKPEGLQPWLNIKQNRLQPWLNLKPEGLQPWLNIKQNRLQPWLNLKPEGLQPWLNIKQNRLQPWLNLKPEGLQPWLNIKQNRLQPWLNLKPKMPQPWLNLKPNRLQSWWNLKPKRPQPWLNIKPNWPQPWLNLKSSWPQPWWNLIPKSPQPWLNLTPKMPQPWLNLKPKEPQPWLNLKPKEPQLWLNLKPKMPQPWLNLKPSWLQPWWNLKPRESQPWLNFKPKKPQPWLNLTPRIPQPWLDLKPKEPQPWLNLKPKEPQLWLNLKPKMPQPWLNLKPSWLQPWWNLKPKESQPWLNLTPKKPQPWLNLTPRLPQPRLNVKPNKPLSWWDFKSKGLQPWLNIKPNKPQQLLNLNLLEFNGQNRPNNRIPAVPMLPRPVNPAVWVTKDSVGATVKSPYWRPGAILSPESSTCNFFPYGESHLPNPPKQPKHIFTDTFIESNYKDNIPVNRQILLNPVIPRVKSPTDNVYLLLLREKLQTIIYLIPKPFNPDEEIVFHKFLKYLNSTEILELLEKVDFSNYNNDADLLRAIIYYVKNATPSIDVKKVFSSYLHFQEIRTTGINYAVLINALPQPMTDKEKYYYNFIAELLFGKDIYYIIDSVPIKNAPTLLDKLLVLLSQLVQRYDIISPNDLEACQYYLTVLEGKRSNIKFDEVIKLLPDSQNDRETHYYNLIKHILQSNDIYYLMRDTDLQYLTPVQILTVVLNTLASNNDYPELLEAAKFYRNYLLTQKYGFDYLELLNQIHETEENKLFLIILRKYFTTLEFEQIVSHLQISNLTNIEKLLAIFEGILTSSTDIQIREAATYFLQKLKLQIFKQYIEKIIQLIPAPKNENEVHKYGIVKSFLITKTAFEILNTIDFSMFSNNSLLLEFVLRTIVESPVEPKIRDAFEYYVDLNEKLENVEFVTTKEIKKKFKLSEIFSDTLDLKSFTLSEKNAFRQFFKYITQISPDALNRFDSWDEARTRGEFVKLLFTFLLKQFDTPPEIKASIAVLNSLVQMNGKGALPP